MDGRLVKFAHMSSEVRDGVRQTRDMRLPDPVQTQVDAYNARDVERFVACYSPDAETFRYPFEHSELAGADAIRERYARLFEAEPDLRCEIRGRVRAGRWTVDEEYVTRSDGPLHCLVAYRVTEGLIDRVLFLDSPAVEA